MSFTLLLLAPLLASELTAATSLDRAPLPRAASIGFLPRGLTSFGSAIDGGWLYVLGGYHGTPHEYSIEGQSGAFMRINLLDTRDIRLLDDVEPVQGAELVRWKGRLIRVGGMHARNTAAEPARLESSAEVGLFDPAGSTWERLPDMPAPRSSHRAVVVGDTMYVLGGWTLGASHEGAKQSPAWAQTYLTFDLAHPDTGWIEHDAPFRARAAGAAVMGERVVLIGGLTPDRSITSDVWVLDPESATWRTGPTFPDWGFGVTATELSGGAKIAASGRSGRVYSLEGEADSERWSACGELTHGRIFHEIEDDGARGLIALGGIVGMETRGRLRTIERIDLGAPLGTQRTRAVQPASVERVTVPAPTAAKNRFGLFVDARSVFLFGGNNSLGQHDFEAENFMNEAWRLDLGNLEWTQLADLPVRRQTMQVSMAPGGESGQRAFAVGGFGHDGEDAVTQSGSWIYDVEFDDWSAGPELLGSRTQFGLVPRGEELWVFGGLDFDPTRPDGEQFDHRLDVLRWDGESASFVDSGVRLPQARRAFAGASIGDRYFMIGGMGEGFAPVMNASVFDFATSDWSEIPAPTRPRVGADLVPIGNALYLVGGSSPSLENSGARGLSSNPSVERLDSATLTWTTEISNLGMEMKHARALGVDGRLCVFTLHRDGQARAEVTFVQVGAAPGSGHE